MGERKDSKQQKYPVTANSGPVAAILVHYGMVTEELNKKVESYAPSGFIYGMSEECTIPEEQKRLLKGKPNLPLAESMALISDKYFAFKQLPGHQLRTAHITLFAMKPENFKKFTPSEQKFIIDSLVDYPITIGDRFMDPTQPPYDFKNEKPSVIPNNDPKVALEKMISDIKEREIFLQNRENSRIAEAKDDALRKQKELSNAVATPPKKGAQKAPGQRTNPGSKVTPRPQSHPNPKSNGGSQNNHSLLSPDSAMPEAVRLAVAQLSDIPSYSQTTNNATSIPFKAQTPQQTRKGGSGLGS